MTRNEQIAYVAGAIQYVTANAVLNIPENMPDSYKSAWAEGFAHIAKSVSSPDHTVDVPTLVKS